MIAMRLDIDMLWAQTLSIEVKVGAASLDQGLRIPWDLHMPRCSACCVHSLCVKHLVVMLRAQPLSTVLAAAWRRAVSPDTPSNKCIL